MALDGTGALLTSLPAQTILGFSLISLNHHAFHYFSLVLSYFLFPWSLLPVLCLQGSLLAAGSRVSLADQTTCSAQSMTPVCQSCTQLLQ